MKGLTTGGNVTKLTHKEESKQRIIDRIKELAILLGGEAQELITSNSSGHQSKKIVIEYDHHTKEVI